MLTRAIAGGAANAITQGASESGFAFLAPRHACLRVPLEEAEP